MTTAEPRGSSNRVLYALIGALLAVMLVGSGGYLFLTEQRPVALTVGGPFTLIDGDGKRVTDQTYRGEYLLVYFGYTFCPDVCPATLNNVADALDKMGAKAARVRPLFITVDPKRDTPAVVKQYAAAFGPRFVGLTGSGEQIAAVAKEIDADLIIISTHGHTGLKHVFLGSVTENVARIAPCPVLVVREEEHEFLRG